MKIKNWLGWFTIICLLAAISFFGTAGATAAVSQREIMAWAAWGFLGFAGCCAFGMFLIIGGDD